MDFDEFASMQELAGSMQGLPEAFAESPAFRKFMVELLMAMNAGSVRSWMNGFAP